MPTTGAESFWQSARADLLPSFCGSACASLLCGSKYTPHPTAQETIAVCAGRQTRGGRLVPGSTLQAQDIVYLTFTTVERHALVACSRVWRQVMDWPKRCCFEVD